MILSTLTNLICENHHKYSRSKMAMDIFLFGHGPRKGETQVLSEPMQDWLANQEIERCVVFTTTERPTRHGGN